MIHGKVRKSFFCEPSREGCQAHFEHPFVRTTIDELGQQAAQVAGAKLLEVELQVVLAPRLSCVDEHRGQRQVEIAQAVEMVGVDEVGQPSVGGVGLSPAFPSLLLVLACAFVRFAVMGEQTAVLGVCQSFVL